MKRSMLWISISFALLLIIAAIIIFTTRGEKGVAELPFETIEIAEIPGTGFEYQGLDPNLVIITGKGGIQQLGNTISTTSQSMLETLDFNKYLALVVFQGFKGTTLYGVEVQRITRLRNIVNIYAHFTERDPSIGAGDIVTSPYHIVKIPRQGLKGNIEFILYANGEEAIRQTYTLP